MKLVVLEAISTILVVVGVILLAAPKISGLYIMVFAQCGWLVYASFKSQWFFASQALFLLIVNIFAIRNWRKKGIGV